MFNISILICNFLIMCCVAYSLYSVRVMFKKYESILNENKAKDSAINELLEENEKLKFINNFDNLALPKFEEGNSKKRGPKMEKTTEKIEKALKLLKKDDELTLINAFSKVGLNTASTSRTLRMHGKYEEWLRIKDARRRKPYDMVNQIVEKKKCTVKEACEEVGFTYARYFQLKAQYENI